MSANHSLSVAVLTHLGNGRTVTWTAQVCNLMPRQVLDIAREHDAVRSSTAGDMANPVAAAAAAMRLRAAPKEPVKQHAAAPVRVNQLEQPAERSDVPTSSSSPPSAPTSPPGPDTQLADVPLDLLHLDPDNPRQDVGDVTELAASMEAVDLLQPIVARKDATGRLIVVAGHRRLAAARLLGWATAPTLIRRDMRPDDVLAAMLIENGHRKDLDPIEEARALRRLQVMHGDCSHSTLAAKLGRHQSHISARLALLALSVEDQDAVRAGNMKLVEATTKARLNSGRIAPRRPGAAYFSAAHDLAPQAKARCRRLHTRVVTMPGGIACGDCWTSVIRVDERQHLHTHSARTGTCALCAAPLAPPAEQHDPTPIREAHPA